MTYNGYSKKPISVDNTRALKSFLSVKYIYEKNT